MKINRNITNLEQNLIMDGQVFEEVQNYRYLVGPDKLKKKNDDTKLDTE